MLKRPNTPSKRDVLGTVLCGHRRYAHISALRGDNLNAPWLGTEGVVSEDSVRRNLGKSDEAEGMKWLQAHLDGCVAPVLGIPWILDVDVTVKPLYEHQQGAVKGCNPHKPGPSRTYHTYFIANLCLILDVEAEAGNQSASTYSSPGLWEQLGRLPRAHWPVLIRGDRDWGTEANRARAEQEGVGYLFKLRLTSGVKKSIERLMRGAEWCDAGDPQQLRLSFAALTDEISVYEYAVLITSLGYEIFTIAPLYHNRGDAENAFDELKNHWGWGGFTTHDLKGCCLMACICDGCQLRHFGSKLLASPRTDANPTHHPAMPWAHLPGFMAELRGNPSASSPALQWLILTSTHTSETLGVRWSEVDTETGISSIPASRIMARRTHGVPLSAACLALLDQVPRIAGNPYVFPRGEGGATPQRDGATTVNEGHGSWRPWREVPGGPARVSTCL